MNGLLTYFTGSEFQYVTAPLENLAPTAHAGPDQLTVVSGTTVTLDSSASTDDNYIVSRKWTKLSGPAVELSDINAVQTEFTPPESTSSQDFVFQVKVEDADGLTDTATVNITVLGLVIPNLAPIADAGEDQLAVVAGSTVTLDSSASRDDDGTIVSRKWTKLSGQDVVLSDDTAIRPTFSAPIRSSDSSYTFQVEVTDDNGSKSSSSVNITVLGEVVIPNVPPTANAGANLSNITAGTEVQLSGLASTDLDGTIVAWSWRQVSGSTVGLSDDEIAEPKYFAPSTATAQTLVFELTVEDDQGATSTTTVSHGIIADSSINYENAVFNIIRFDVNLCSPKPVGNIIKGSLYDNADTKIIVEINGGYFNPRQFTSIRFGLFTLSGTTALITKTLGYGINLVGNTIEIIFTADEINTYGRVYFEIIGEGLTQVNLERGYMNIVDARL